MNDEYFAQRLRELRTGKGLTKEGLARVADVSKSLVADLENSRYAPSWPTVVKLAEALGVGVEEFAKAPTTPGGTLGRGRPPKKKADDVGQVETQSTDGQATQKPVQPTAPKKRAAKKANRRS
jgi:transcriptional regulator with XRE-family HTH domain